MELYNVYKKEQRDKKFWKKIWNSLKKIVKKIVCVWKIYQKNRQKNPGNNNCYFKFFCLSFSPFTQFFGWIGEKNLCVRYNKVWNKCSNLKSTGNSPNFLGELVKKMYALGVQRVNIVNIFYKVLTIVNK